MTKLRNIVIYLMLPLLFLWYIGGITLFPHTHFVGGVAVVHSHPFADAEHQGEDSLLTIDMLCHFNSDAHSNDVVLPAVAFVFLSKEQCDYKTSEYLQDYYWTFCLRGPPEA